MSAAASSSSSPLRGVATCRSGRRAGQSGSCRHRPYEGSQRDVFSSGLRTAMGRHRPYEGSQPEYLSRYNRNTRRHRPYEGSQHRPLRTVDDRRQVVIAPTRGRNWPYSACTRGLVRMSSSPLRGVATPACRRPHRPGARVVIAPTRGRNVSDTRTYRMSLRGSSSPLRGVATVRSAHAARCCPWSSSPLRGVATYYPRRPDRDIPGRHRPYEGSQLAFTLLRMGYTAGRHRPYEGSQLLLRPRMVPRVAASSSPLRGVATVRPAPRGRKAAQVVIAPTRGRNFARRQRGQRELRRRHRPYEGSQLLPALHDVLLNRRVVIAPTRGRNMPAWASARGSATVVIAPTRGRNTTPRPRRTHWWPSRHRPYEGSQRWRLWCGGSFRCDVVIAPTRGRNVTAGMICP